jgi:hypothetical protein
MNFWNKFLTTAVALAFFVAFFGPLLLRMWIDALNTCHG